MNDNYLALIQGGLGPDVWDKELKIFAADFCDAAIQAAAKAEELGGQVVELSRNDYPNEHAGKTAHAWFKLHEVLRQDVARLTKELADSKDAYLNMRNFAESKGLDTATRG